MINKILKASTLVVIALAATGCTGMSGQFGCNATAQDTCTPVSAINAKADSGDYDEHPSNNIPQANAMLMSYQLDNDTNLTDAPLRGTESVKRVWIAPFVDMQDNYHQANTVYTVMNKPYWISESVQEIQKNG